MVRSSLRRLEAVFKQRILLIMSSAYYVIQLHCGFYDKCMLNIEVFSVQLDYKQVEHNSNCTNLIVNPIQTGKSFFFSF